MPVLALAEVPTIRFRAAPCRIGLTVDFLRCFIARSSRGSCFPRGRGDHDFVEEFAKIDQPAHRQPWCIHDLRCAGSWRCHPSWDQPGRAIGRAYKNMRCTVVCAFRGIVSTDFTAS